MSFQDDVPSIPNDNLKDHFVLMLDLISKQDKTENCQFPKIVGKPLNFSFSGFPN